MCFMRFFNFTGSHRVRVLCFTSVLVGPGRVSQKCSWGLRGVQPFMKVLRRLYKVFSMSFMWFSKVYMALCMLLTVSFHHAIGLSFECW